MTELPTVGGAGPTGPSPAALQVSGISKTFAGTRALIDLELTVDAGSVHALLGENGSGKSTFIKILSGFHVPDPGGRALVSGAPIALGTPGSAHALGCRFVHQDLGLVDTSSIADNMCLTKGFPTRWGTVRGKELRQRTRAALARVGLDLDPRTPVGELSPAVRTGVVLARALDDDDAPVRLLVLDEPTATLPDGEVRELLGTVRAAAATGVGILYVTHHLDEVFEIADDVTVLRDGRKVITTTAAQLTRPALVTHLVGRELEDVGQASDALPREHGDPVLQVTDVVAGPVRGVSLTLRPGDLVGVAGVTGSGRETVLGATFGASARTGSVTVAGATLPPARPDLAIAAGVAFLSADRARQGGVMSLAARENLVLPRLAEHWRLPALRRKGEAIEAQRWFARLDVRPPTATEATLGSFSGGNQQKILVGKWLRNVPRVLLLDEPTQGVDIGAKAVIHAQVLAAAAAGAAVLVASSSYDELVALCHRVLVIRHGRLVAELTGARLTVANLARESLGAEGSAA